MILRQVPGARPRARGHALPRRTSSFRQEIVHVHREIFRRNRKQINSSVSGYTAAFRRYERDYASRVRTYRRRANMAQLDRAMAQADLVYVGDYHTLPQAQRGFLRLLRRLPPDRPVSLALEFVQGRHQKAIDAYLAGYTNDEEFLRAIDHESHWVFGGWSGFRRIFELAKERGYDVCGVDTLGRGPAGTSLQARDRYAARRIAKLRRQRPDDLIMVLIGELHVAPPHLPALVTEELATWVAPRDNERTELFIYQNCEEIYWTLEEKGLEHDTELVQISTSEYCLMNTPPIVCQQSFLNWLQAEDDGLQWETPEVNFKEYVRLIAAFFDLPMGEAVEEVEVASVVDLSFLRRLKQRGDFSNEDMERIRKQIVSSESYYIPRAKMVYLGNLSVNHASEEATHFVRHVCSDSHEPRMLVDAFYWRVLEETVGFLGSKIINHRRKCAHLPDFKRFARSRAATRSERRIANLVLKHARMVGGKRVRSLSSLYECDADTFNAVTHAIGYRLGDMLYYALLSGYIDKKEIRDLFFDTFDGVGDALTTYLYLSARTRDVRLPERL